MPPPALRRRAARRAPGLQYAASLEGADDLEGDPPSRRGIHVADVGAEGGMISFRPVTDDDYEYLYALNEATMRGFAGQTYGAWDEAIARQLFAERWHPESVRIVV